MRAALLHVEYGTIARFERISNHSLERIWTVLTDTEEISIWFMEIKSVDLKVGGQLQFVLSDGRLETCTFTEVKPPTVLEYTWGKDLIRFELNYTEDGSKLLLNQIIDTITEETPEVLTNWHLSLDSLIAYLNGDSAEFSDDYTKGLHEDYKQLIFSDNKNAK